MSTQTDTPKVQIASAQYKGDGVVELVLETDDRVKVTFELGALAMATLLLTLGPAGKLALHDLEKKQPPPGHPAMPDSPEGLEG